MRGEEVQLLLILNLGTKWGWVVSVTPWPRFTPGERTPGTHWIGGSVGPRAGLDAGARRKILCLCRGSNPGLPVRSQTLYCLSYHTLLTSHQYILLLEFIIIVFLLSIKPIFTNHLRKFLPDFCMRTGDASQSPSIKNHFLAMYQESVVCFQPPLM
jgi:hypothetical protein